MFARKSVLSLVIPFLVSQAVGEVQLDVSDPSSIKSVAKTLASGIIGAYNEALKEDRIPGLFGDRIYWWEAGTVWNSLIGYSYLTGDSTYDETISEALLWQLGDFNAFMPPNQTKELGNEDQACWGLSAMTAAEVGFAKPKSAEWVDYAVNVWNTQATRLDYESENANGTCGGGLRWQIFRFNSGYEYKNAWSNGNFFLLSARLAKFTGNATYAQYANKVFKWSKDIGLVGEGYEVHDGTSANRNCSSVNQIQWSATNGIFTEGAALMYNMTGAQNWTDAVNGLVKSSSVFQSEGDNPVIVEVACEKNGKCSIDHRAYKGVFARTYARAALAAPFVAESIGNILSSSAKGAIKSCKGSDEDVACSLTWTQPVAGMQLSAKDGNIGEVFSALEVVQGLLYSSVSKDLNVANGSNTSGGNNTKSGDASRTSGVPSQSTGAAGSVAVNGFAVIAVAFAAALIC